MDYLIEMVLLYIGLNDIRIRICLFYFKIYGVEYRYLNFLNKLGIWYMYGLFYLDC